MYKKLANSAINSMVYFIIAKGEIILEDENMTEEAACFIDNFNSLYHDKNDDEVKTVINIFKDEYNGENSIYSNKDYLNKLSYVFHELCFTDESENYFYQEAKKAYENRKADCV